MVIAAAFANFVSFGILFSFGLFLTPLAEEFDTSTGPIAPLLSGSIFFYYLASAVAGRLADRRGPRLVTAFGAIALPLGLVLSSFAGSLWQLYVLYMPLAGLGVGSCYSPLIGAVGRRFVERRAVAIAALLTGLGGGSLAMPLLVRFLLDHMDWRQAFQVLALLSLVVLGSAALAATKRPTVVPATMADPLVVFRSAAFRRLYLSVVLVAPGFYAPLAFLNDYAVAHGITTGRAALLLAVIGLGSFSTRLAFGGAAQRFGALRQYRLSHAMMLTALIIWLASGGSFWALAASALIQGFGWAAWVTAAPVVLADWFGVEDLGLLVGGFYTGLGIGALLGPSISGFVIDRAGYDPALAAVVVTSAVSLALLLAPLRAGNWLGPQSIPRATASVPQPAT
ncbi:MAG: MFS transporter [Acidimicrobiales bacterium]